MELDVKEQTEKLKEEAQRIGKELSVIQQQATQLQQRHQLLINETLKNQGALDLLNNLNGKEEPKKDKA